MTGLTSPRCIRPDSLFGCFRTQPVGLRLNPHPWEIQAIGIPANLDAQVPFGHAICMVDTREP